MDAVLLTLTIVALVAAAGFGALTWRLLREERSRSAARVAALASAIDGVEPATAPSAVGDLFAPAHSDAARGMPVIRLAAGVVMALILIVAVAAGRGERSGSDTPPAAAAGSAPLELLSMRHARDGDTFTVSGLVRNPPVRRSPGEGGRAGGEVTRVTAVVFAFDRAGTFVASGRAPLDFTTLDPGDESPFVVTIPRVSEVGRYRVSFRTEDGAVRHVDRRGEASRLAAVDLK